MGDKVVVFYLEEILKVKVVKIKEEFIVLNYVVEVEVMVKIVDGEYMVLYMSVLNVKV